MVVVGKQRELGQMLTYPGPPNDDPHHVKLNIGDMEFRSPKVGTVEVLT